ncbi:MAG: DapH/DapD/GlmU-related protein, partial [Bdellovibrionales bacterium]
TEMPTDDVMGINTRVHLAQAEKIMQDRLREKCMKAGVTMTDPQSVFLSVDTKIAHDVTIGPNVVIGPGVSIETGVTIHPFCHLEQATIAAGAQIGPYARLRPQAVIGEGAHIGNFVEIKKADIAPGAKVNHLSYIGDATIGAKTNIGAGTITCNYDGYVKSKTEIGAGVFVGSNTALVAPIKIGDGAVIAAGSTLTQDVPPDALALARAHQEVLPERAKQYHAAHNAAKREKP